MKTKISLFKFVLLISLFSCQSQAVPSTVEVTTVSILKTPLIIRPSNTNTPVSTLTITPFPSSTMTLTPSPLPSHTLTPTKTPTAIPIPSLELSVAQSLVYEFLETNNGCIFSCWWGITPGQTKWYDVEPFLMSFASGSYHPFDTTKRIITYELFFPLPGGVNDQLQIFYLVEDGIIQSIEVGPGPVSYTIRLILEQYGQPDEVWVSTTNPILDENGVPYNDHRFIDVALLYINEGFLIDFTDLVDYQNGYLYGCFNPSNIISFSRLFLWSPKTDEINSFAEIKEKEESFFGPPFRFLPIEQATSLTKETFYQIFKDQNQAGCIETPADLWPYS